MKILEIAGVIAAILITFLVSAVYYLKDDEEFLRELNKIKQ